MKSFVDFNWEAHCNSSDLTLTHPPTHWNLQHYLYYALKSQNRDLWNAGIESIFFISIRYSIEHTSWDFVTDSAFVLQASPNSELRYPPNCWGSSHCPDCTVHQTDNTEIDNVNHDQNKWNYLFEKPSTWRRRKHRQPNTCYVGPLVHMTPSFEFMLNSIFILNHS